MNKRKSFSGAVAACVFLSLFVLAPEVCEARKKGILPAVSEGNYDGTIVALGDSLTRGHRKSKGNTYPDQLERKLHAGGYNYRVVNAGIGGDKTHDILERLDWVLDLNPEIVILEIGINDGHRSRRIETIERNIEEIISILKQSDIIVVLAGMRVIKNAPGEYAEAFKNIYPRVAKRQGVILVPDFQAGVGRNPELVFPDGYHTTARGDGVVMNNVYPYVIQAIRESKSVRGKAPRRPAGSVRQGPRGNERIPAPGAYRKPPAPPSEAIRP